VRFVVRFPKIELIVSTLPQTLLVLSALKGMNTTFNEFHKTMARLSNLASVVDGQPLQ
jgi:hypothetical protein